MINKINNIFTRKQKIHLIILLFMIIIGAFVELIGVSAIMPFVELLTSDSFDNFLLKEFVHLLGTDNKRTMIILSSIFIIITYMLKNIYLIFLNSVQVKFTYSNQKKLAVRLMKTYMSQPYTFFCNTNSAELVRTINEDVNRCFLVISHGLQMITELVTGFVLLIYLMLSDITITLTLLLMLTFWCVIFIKIFRTKSRAYGFRYQKASAKMIQWLNQAFGGIKEIKVLNRKHYFVNSYENNYNEYAKAQEVFQILGQVPKSMLEFFCILAVMIALIIEIANGRPFDKMVVQISVFVIAAYRLLPSANRINNNLNTIMFNIPSLNKIYADLQLETAENNHSEIKHNVLHFNERLEIKKVFYSYPDSDKDVLNGIDLSIEKGSSAAIIGNSGAGKTTLADLILGLLTPTKGSITVDGTDIHKNPESWSKMIGYIPQNIYLCDDTIRNNVALGCNEESIDDSDVWEALRQAQLDDHIRGLENGLDTEIGEFGLKLSGGQRQRIGIARALYHKPQILILDEATSALDTETEKAVMEAIESFQGNKTMIVIAHRLSTIKNCDTVYRIENGTAKTVSYEERKNW